MGVFQLKSLKIDLNSSTFFLLEITTEITGLCLPSRKCVSGSEADVLLLFLVLLLKQLVHTWL